MSAGAAAALRRRLADAWARSDAIFAALPEAVLLARPIPLRHPFLFYLGHLPAFAANQVLRGVLGHPGLDPGFEELFERGIDPPDTGPSPAAAAAWPEVSAVLRYRDRVRR